MGVSGSGKSVVAQAIARAMGLDCVDGDDLHLPASVAKMARGTPLDDADRWPWLDRLGAAIGAAVAEGGIVIAACSALKRGYRERLERAAGVPLRFVCLDGDRAAIGERLAARTRHYMPPGLLDSQFAALERPAADERALILPCYRPIEELGEAIVDWLQG